MSNDAPYRGRSYEEVLMDLLKNPEFRAEWERLTVPRNLASYLLRVRYDRGLTETAFARELGMSQPAYARLDLGEHVPTLGTLKKLANALGVTFRIDVRPDRDPAAEGAGEPTEIVELWPESDIAPELAERKLRSAAD